MTVVQWQSQLAQNTDQVVAQSGKLVREVRTVEILKMLFFLKFSLLLCRLNRRRLTIWMQRYYALQHVN